MIFAVEQVFYKDDLNWMKGIGCYVWDTPEILRAKKSYELQSEVSKNMEDHRRLSEMLLMIHCGVLKMFVFLTFLPKYKII